MPLTIIIGLFFMQFLEFTLNTATLLATGMSVGILLTNSIVVLEAIAKRLDRTGDVKESARLGAKEAFVAVLGMMPLAMGTGIGAELRNACGIASVGGIFVSGLLTLFVMPAIYNLFTRKNHSKSAR